MPPTKSGSVRLLKSYWKNCAIGLKARRSVAGIGCAYPGLGVPGTVIPISHFCETWAMSHLVTEMGQAQIWV